LECAHEFQSSSALCGPDGKVGVMVEIEEELNHRRITSTHVTDSEIVALGASLHVTASLREFANDELLRQAGADPFRGSDCEVPKDKANAAIRSRKIKV
jgi:hypothetical protein